MYLLKNRFLTQQKKLKYLSARVFKAHALILSESNPYDVIEEYKHCKIRYYASPDKKYKEPLVFVAPLAINMAIYDLYPYRSLIKHFQHSGFDVYLLEWSKLNYQDRFLNFMSFIDDALPHCIETICQHSNSKDVSLHGWSMAGVFVTLYTALYQSAKVKNLIVLGSPIDSYASGRIGKLFQRINTLISHNHALRKALYNGHIPKHLIHTPGVINALGFKILDPKGWLNSQKQFLLNLSNPRTVYEHATMGNFLNHMIDYPGGINQDMVFNVWLQNPLKNGVIQLENKIIELKNITCPLFIGAGSSDQIVTAEAAQPLGELTSSQDVAFTLIPGGHLGLMSSQKSANIFWPKLTAWLQHRSTLLDANN